MGGLSQTPPPLLTFFTAAFIPAALFLPLRRVMAVVLTAGFSLCPPLSGGAACCWTLPRSPG